MLAGDRGDRWRDQFLGLQALGLVAERRKMVVGKNSNSDDLECVGSTERVPNSPYIPGLVRVTWLGRVCWWAHAPWSHRTTWLLTILQLPYLPSRCLPRLTFGPEWRYSATYPREASASSLIEPTCHILVKKLNMMC